MLVAGQTINKLAHTWGDWTDDKDGEHHTHTCTVCTTASETENHAWNDGVVSIAPTCTAKGERTFTCTKCGATKTEDIDPTGIHTYTETVDDKYIKSEANCTSAAIYYKSCSMCGEKGAETFTHGEKNANNHVGGTHIENAKPATYTENGYTGDTVCNSCKAVLVEGSVIGKLDADQPKISGENKTVGKGKTVSVDVVLQNNPGMNYLSINFTYDSAALTLKGVAPTSLIGTCPGVQNIETVNGSFVLVWAGAANSTAEGTLVTLTFEANENAEASDYVIDMTVVECYNSNDAPINAYAEDFVISVVNYLIGDVNGDGKVNGKDATRFLQKLANWDVGFVEGAADTNGDGKVNGKDVTRLLQYLANWDVKLGK